MEMHWCLFAFEYSIACDFTGVRDKRWHKHEQSWANTLTTLTLNLNLIVSLDLTPPSFSPPPHAWIPAPNTTSDYSTLTKSPLYIARITSVAENMLEKTQTTYT